MNTKAIKYLVTEGDGTTHLPYTGDDGKPDHRLMGAAWAALHGGYRGEKYAGRFRRGGIAEPVYREGEHNADVTGPHGSGPIVIDGWSACKISR